MNWEALRKGDPAEGSSQKIGINYNDPPKVDRCQKLKGGNVVRNFHDWIWREKEEEIKSHS